MLLYAILEGHSDADYAKDELWGHYDRWRKLAKNTVWFYSSKESKLVEAMETENSMVAKRQEIGRGVLEFNG